MQTINIPVPSDVKGLIFDMDGTILDSMPLHHDGYNHALARYGIHYPRDIFESRGGIPTRDTMSIIQEDYGIVNFDIERALEDKKAFVERNLERTQMIEPVFEIIKDYHGKLPMAIGTGSNRRVVNELFERFSLGQYIEHVVTATEVTQYKPHPETFLKCAELIGVRPVDCAVFEDGKPGIQAAKAAGMKVVDVTKYL
ncbi:haloacid dehalogenase superfamily, subfamily IA, variant 3 with third motif having DD or ED/beta-phosphoglucomutase family hydrolase [Reichenbachiella faecimaris]|uniref:Haloacid dehalogenase superfamily, subfamily IA, variant 3 with third motif having DD or ED/beta-phosphoglucomutase family hydrolase n=1 Tax=Reichenbachiella faecimaris TaxID=692418 RepID=A0A1W2GN12_REIFA|nr:HAD-IA family hydrolase [Reichenbachiella faecimaris]SMD38060.1 haloacid dehalogenase superfamily, subfamily IA, variant 3 with third motif having DD or ED/beta-phosphoglucomutase family hydrolase [Reichenbachiella faecimaris]